MKRNIVFLSAQPDDYYFLWQLELQLYNFHRLGVPAERIHVLIGYKPEVGLSNEFKEFVKVNHYATFFIYPDNREQAEYLSSLRPHIIKQHILRFSELKNNSIFYHDSDILLRRIPEFNKMLGDDCWYVSDTHSYLDSNYIKNSGGSPLFIEMCKWVGITPEKVEMNDDCTGGAQYLLKNTSYEFWDKLERDCEGLYHLLSRHNNIGSEKYHLETGNPLSKYHGIQAWCADMWVLLWNAWLFGHEVKIHPELDFCWPYENIKRWGETKILHYAGVTDKKNEKLFCKGKYIHYPPHYEDLDLIDPGTCSYPIIELMHNYQREQANKKINLSDVSFLIPVRIDSEDRMENLYIVTKFLDKYFKTNIIVLEADTTSKVNRSKLPEVVRYIFQEDFHEAFHHTKYNNILTDIAETPIISVYDTDVIFPIKQITDAVFLIRQKMADCVYPYSGDFVSVDRLFKAMFRKLLDPELLSLNRGKFGTGTWRSFGGAAFLRKDSFVSAGKDNEYLDSWGPEDIERPKRMKILGFEVKRINGPLFHLPHERSVSSGYSDQDTRIRLMEEYLEVCSRNKNELRDYVSSWSWIKDFNKEN